MRMTILCSSLTIALAGCATDVRPADEGLVASDTPLGRVGEGVGVTLDPVTGELWVLDDVGRLWVRDDGGWSERRQIFTSRPTDVIAVGWRRFAITGVDMGYMLRLSDELATPHFCYVPPARSSAERDQPRPPIEVSRAVTYDPFVDQLYAQPQTIEDRGEGAPIRSEVAAFDLSSGEELRFQDVGSKRFSAGGMAVLRGSDEPFAATLLLGEGSILYRYDMAEERRRAFVDLASLGVDRIEGLAIDRDADRLLVLDEPGHRILHLELRGIAQAAGL